MPVQDWQGWSRLAQAWRRFAPSSAHRFLALVAALGIGHGAWARYAHPHVPRRMLAKSSPPEPPADEFRPPRSSAFVRSPPILGPQTSSQHTPTDVNDAKFAERSHPISSRTAPQPTNLTPPVRAGPDEPASPGFVGRLNINEADATQWQLLPGVGPKIAQRILQTRARHPFARVSALRRVRGIGPVFLRKWGKHLVVHGPTTLRRVPKSLTLTRGPDPER